MSMYRIVTRNKPRSKLVREVDPDTRCVRVYKNSPEDMHLQIWDGKRYMLVALFPEEARSIARALVEAAEVIEKSEVAA